MPDQYASKMPNHDRQKKIVTDQRRGKELSHIEENAQGTT